MYVHYVRMCIYRCPVEPTVTLYPINDTMTAFRFQSFRFVNVTSLVLYLHCASSTCSLSDNSGNCDSNCRSPASARRRRRHVDNIIMTYDISSGPFVVVITVTPLTTSPATSVTPAGDSLTVATATKKLETYAMLTSRGRDRLLGHGRSGMFI